MDKVLIFTNIASLGFNNSDKRRSKKNISLIKDNKFIVYNYSKCEFEVTESIQAGEIFLILDEVDSESFKSFVGDYDRKNLLALYHKKGADVLDGFIPRNCLKGTHELKIDRNGLYYDEVMSVLVDNSSNKFYRIERILTQRKRNLVIDLLHNLFVNRTDELLPEIDKDNDEKIQKSYKNWKTNKTSENLKPLRDVLFEWAKH